MTSDESPSDPFEREANESKFTGAHESTPVTLSLEEYRVLKRIAHALERIADAKEKQVELLHRRDVLGLR